METSGVMENRALLKLRKVTATQSSPLTHSQSHQAQNTVEHTGVKQGRAWTKQEIREVIPCYMCCRQHFTENYKKMYEIWRQRNPECKMHMDVTKKTNESEKLHYETQKENR